MSTSSAWATALRLLTRRGYCAAELATRLRAKEYPEPEIAAALERCRDLGYLDDAQYAGMRARALLRSGRAVGRRAYFDLTRRGVDAQLAATAVTEAEAEHPAAELLRTMRERRYPHFNYAAADDNERRRVVNFFLRRGFELSLVLSILTQERDDL